MRKMVFRTSLTTHGPNPIYWNGAILPVVTRDIPVSILFWEDFALGKGPNRVEPGAALEYGC